MHHRRFHGTLDRFPSPRELDVLDAIDALAGRSSGRHRSTGKRRVQDADCRAIQVYLIRTALGWSFSRLERRLRLTLKECIRAYPCGRALVHGAVAREEITPAMLARLLPSRMFL